MIIFLLIFTIFALMTTHIVFIIVENRRRKKMNGSGDGSGYDHGGG